MMIEELSMEVSTEKVQSSPTRVYRRELRNRESSPGEHVRRHIRQLLKQIGVAEIHEDHAGTATRQGSHEVEHARTRARRGRAVARRQIRAENHEIRGIRGGEKPRVI